MKRSGTSKTSGKQYTYYCCEFTNNKKGERTCDFMTWDVPTKEDCPLCGQTMFKKAGRGFNKPFCANPACSNFLPEDKRGYRRRKTADGAENAEGAAETAAAAEDTAKKTTKTAAKKTTAKTTKTAAAKKTAAKTAEKEPAAKKTAKTAAKKTTTKTTAAKKTTKKAAEKAE